MQHCAGAPEGLNMSVYFKCGTKWNVIRHQGIPTMRSATLESLERRSDAVSKGLNQLSMKQRTALQRLYGDVSNLKTEDLG
jgi:hypothetical protein